MGGSSYISEVCRQRTIILEQQTELQQKEKQYKRSLQKKDMEIKERSRCYKEELAEHDEAREARVSSQRITIAELVQRMDQQATLISQLHPGQSLMKPMSETSDSNPSEPDRNGIQLGDRFFINSELDNLTNMKTPSVQKQLTRITSILREVNAKTKGKGGHTLIKPVKKKDCNQTVASVGRLSLQCHRCLGWGHFIKSCASKADVEGSVEWKNIHGVSQ